MPSGDLGALAEAQRETVRALAVLTERLGTPAEQERAGREAPPGFERALESTAQVIGELGDATAANTQALTGLSREIGGLPGLLAGLANGARSGGGVLTSVLGSGLGLGPLALRIAGLFRGREEEPPAVNPYTAPPSLAMEVANTGLSRVDRSQRGEPRPVEAERPVVYQPQVTVNVSAMDSRSFLDHSGEIARAVRDAMLHMHPVNDLISEL